MEAMSSDDPLYLNPYVRAAAKHGAGFGALLWASPATQAARFDAISRLYDFNDARVLDVGCGRADLLDFWTGRGIAPAHYTGLEAVAEFVEAAAAKQRPACTILKGDFVKDPATFDLGADVIVFSGALNTLDEGTFYKTIRRAFDAARTALVFNFLCSKNLAAADWLTWHRKQKVVSFTQRMSDRVDVSDDYLPGDCTVAARKQTA